MQRSRPSLDRLLHDAGDFYPSAPPERLRLYVRDEGEYRIYGLMCPHGKTAARQLDMREYPSERQLGGVIVTWSYAAACELPCACGPWAQSLSLSDFIAATPNWLVEVA